jgi:hypothetical protein
LRKSSARNPPTRGRTILHDEVRRAVLDLFGGDGIAMTKSMVGNLSPASLDDSKRCDVR